MRKAPIALAAGALAATVLAATPAHAQNFTTYCWSEKPGPNVFQVLDARGSSPVFFDWATARPDGGWDDANVSHAFVTPTLRRYDGTLVRTLVTKRINRGGVAAEWIGPDTNIAGERMRMRMEYEFVRDNGTRFTDTCTSASN